MSDTLQLLSGNKIYTKDSIDIMRDTYPNFYIVSTLPDADSPSVQPNAIYYLKLPLSQEQLNSVAFMLDHDINGNAVWRKDAYRIVEELPVDLATVSQDTIYKVASDDDLCYICDTNEQDVKMWFAKPLNIVTKLPAANDPNVMEGVVYKVDTSQSVPVLMAYVLGKDAQGNNCWYTDGDTKSERNYNALINRPSINGEIIWGDMNKEKASAPVSGDGLTGGYDMVIPDDDIRDIVDSVF